MSADAPRTVTLLGSTGSIGTQAIDVVQAHSGRFRVEALSAGGSDVALLAEQVAVTGARAVAVADAGRAEDLRTALADRLGQGAAGVEVLAGPDAATELAGRGSDVVLNGITGSVGLRPTLAALAAGSTLALANKESLVVGGSLVKAAAAPGQIVPVDSEHSAMAQALRSGARAEVRRLILTASGGPFRGRSRDDIKKATAEEALAHPTWSMGPVVTVNSASLMNKGLELIEAHLLFDVPADDITVVVHPQSVVHSMVEFRDGSTIAQASPPDMRLPIALGLSWPERLDVVSPPCDWTQASSWTFEPLDEAMFPAVGLARAAVAASATHPAVYNAANEQGVAAFLAGRIGFLDIVETVERVLGEHDGVAAADVTLEGVEEVERWARERADEILARS
ncbi:MULTISPECIES: 1-deoxy-D-xylulose-5-phosphate reductoisomerase [unclassified Isoptericola]|uniref:1-deoxy-D-xylulose-5-phosphate reductoisomerase n=1 Tax=unclassified Isoptericola TaxID=2623355 RepID=UPI00365538B3